MIGYVGVCAFQSVCCFRLHVEEYIDETKAAIILSMESVFGAIHHASSICRLIRSYGNRMCGYIGGGHLFLICLRHRKQKIKKFAGYKK